MNLIGWLWYALFQYWDDGVGEAFERDESYIITIFRMRATVAGLNIQLF